MIRKYAAIALALAIAQPLAAQDTSETVWMMVQHDVADCAAWREVFDSGLSVRQSAGELQYEVIKKTGEPTAVLAIFEWDGADAALAFVNDPSVQAAMQSAGVIFEPVVHLFDSDPRYWKTTEMLGTPSIELTLED